LDECIHFYNKLTAVPVGIDVFNRGYKPRYPETVWPEVFILPANQVIAIVTGQFIKSSGRFCAYNRVHNIVGIDG
jgi:hypothetical protein